MKSFKSNFEALPKVRVSKLTYSNSITTVVISVFQNFRKIAMNILAKVNAYITSDKFMRGPCNNKMAKWGGDAELKKSW